MPVKHLFGCLLVLGLFILPQATRSASAQDADLRLVVPQHLIDMGLTKHLLPRFRFKTRIRVEPVPEGTDGDASLLPATDEGIAIMSALGGDAYRLLTLSQDPVRQEQTSKLVQWLQSAPGRSAIESFEIDGKQAFAPGVAKVMQKEEVEVEGDASLGSKLALQHCGRCHVIDSRNPFGGIGSTPSFGALKNFPKWLSSFSAFWTINPHPSFTQIEGVTEPFDPARPPPIAPLLLTLEEVEAITAFVAKMPTKDLGGAVEAR